MEMIQLTHAPMPVIGGILYVLGLIFLRIARFHAQADRKSHWFNNWFVQLMIGISLSTLITCGLGFMAAGTLIDIQGIAGSGVDLLLTGTVVTVGWVLLQRIGMATHPASPNGR